MADAPDMIPADQFEAVPTSDAPDVIPADQFEEAGNTPGDTGTALAEGVGEGLIGPAAPWLEKQAGVRASDIRQRAAASPIAKGVGQAIGLVGSSALGAGMGATMGAAGEGAAVASGIGKETLINRIGSEAVKQATEMAILQGSDEVSKQILNDPDASSQTAAANIGLAGLLGGVGGAATAGIISPLWKATAGPKVEELLGMLKGKLNGEGLTVKDGVGEAVTGLGVELTPVEKVMLSEQGPSLGTLVEREHPEAVGAIDSIKDKVANSVADSLGIKPEDALVYDKADAGDLSRLTFENEFRTKLGPIEEQLNKQAAEDALIGVSDQDRLKQFGDMVEQGQKKFTPTSDYAAEYEKYGNQLLDAENIQGVTKIESELGNRIRGMQRTGGDYNTVNALRDIKDMFRDFRENQINKSIMSVSGDKQMAAETIAEKLETRKAYGQAARIIDQAQDHFGLGSFEGKETLANKIAKLSPEQAANKFSFKNNRDAIPFLQQYFPKTYEVVRQNEAKEFLKPALKKGAKQGTAIDVNALDKSIQDMKAGNNTYLQNVIPPEALQRVENAKTILQAMPDFKSSKTAKWTEKLFARMPGSAMAAISFLTGHSPIGGLLAGEMGHRLQTKGVDSVKLGYLKWLASDKPIEAGGFKAMVDFLDNVYKGDSLITKAANNIVKPTAQVLTTSQMPTQKQRDRLDKQVTKLSDDPSKLINENNDLGYYMPDHQTNMSATASRSLQYLKSLKPTDHVLGGLDGKASPHPIENARYQNALDIAQQPAIVLQKIKNGTLQPNDIADLHNMYPSLYDTMVKKVTNSLVGANKSIIPYKTRIGMSLFLGQPVDSTMSPASIQAAQPQPPPVPAAQGGAKGKTRKGTSTLGKSNSSYQTASQSAESDRGDRS